MTIWETLPEITTYVGKPVIIYGTDKTVLKAILIDNTDIYYWGENDIQYSAVGSIKLDLEGINIDKST